MNKKLVFHPSHRLRSTDDGLYTVRCILCNLPDTAPEMASVCSCVQHSWQADFNFLWHLNRQFSFSVQTFGPVSRGTKGVIKHIRKELKEIEDDPSDTIEWIDVVLLALDGAMRAGLTPKDVITKLVEKQLINEGREWPDYREIPDGEPVEHVRLSAGQRRQAKRERDRERQERLRREKGVVARRKGSAVAEEAQRLGISVSTLKRRRAAAKKGL